LRALAPAAQRAFDSASARKDAADPTGQAALSELLGGPSS
jgi:hypothetical protein